jgi:hypothetical protein
MITILTTYDDLRNAVAFSAEDIAKLLLFLVDDEAVLDALNERVPFAEPPAESCGIEHLFDGEAQDLAYGTFDLTDYQRDYLEWERDWKDTYSSMRGEL